MVPLPNNIQALLLLNAYDKKQTDGRTHQKQVTWDLSKARREKNRGSIGVSHAISALDVREELRARSVLREATTPSPPLTDEDSKSNTPSAIRRGDTWTLVDAVEDKDSSSDEKPPPTTSPGVGLRNRKQGGTDSKEEQNQWKEEKVPDEDDRLRNANPIDLFGAFPPRDLRSAQKNAKKALQAYVDAANAAASLLALLNETKKEQKRATE